MRTLKKLVAILVIVGLAGAAAGWILTVPETLSKTQIADLPAGDPVNGELLFWAGGCASCHAAPGATGDDKLLLGGGLKLETPFGVFVAPNISSDQEDGIGGWSKVDFANAMLTGTSPQGSHLYPAFPYTSYARMTLSDVADLYAFMTFLPSVSGKAAAHELGFPFNIRRGLGLWKLLNLSSEPVVSAPAAGSDVDPDLWQRGRYLVEGPGHCGECHTPRDLMGGLDKSRWLSGAAAATGEGRVPGLDPESDIGSWSAADIAYYLESGFTPEYDSVGGEMVSVQENMARLPASDREAIAVYLKALPAAGTN
ncbi:cytochrome c [uncultured Roseibium sp.]|uniref:cytochrome c n=1 Tax=uncultured Roseibium sp. TaxID=1936171 RepID=UPI002598DB94|nr:cytochrome c [uncultured Roseibium sp.]